MSSECPDPKRLLALRDDELPPAEATATRRHIAGCARCREEAALWNEMDRLYEALAPGTAPLPTLPGYRCRKLLGRGGFGSVWLAEDEEMNRLRAVKVLHPGALTREAVQALRAEALALDDLGAHPHRVRVYRVLSHPAGGALVMEYVPGCELAALAPELGAGAEAPWARACRYLAQAADALVDVHANGLRHGDVTPRNVLWHRDRDSAVLTDFGLAARAPDRRGGTAGFAAPEVARGASEPASDVYGLAATAWWLLTGAVYGPANATLPVTAPAELEEVLLEALDHNPKQRPSVARFRDRLRAVPTNWLGAKLRVVVGKLAPPVRLDAVCSTPTAVACAVAGGDVGPAEFVPVAFLEARTGDRLSVRATASRAGFFTLLNLTSQGAVEANPIPGPVPRMTAAGATVEIEGPLGGPSGTEFVAVVWSAAAPAATARRWRDRVLAAWSAAPRARDTDRAFVPVRTATTTSLSDWAAALFVVRHRGNES